jgi:hypothetical protein
MPDPVTAAEGRRWIDAGLACVVLALLALPAVDFGFGLERPPVLVENRLLAFAPGVPASRRALEAFPRQFEAYWNDHFGFRRTLIRYHNLGKLALGVSPSASVVPGRDGWLFLKNDGELDYYRGVPPFSPAELARWHHALEHRRDWLAARGSRYLFVVAPNKSSIYAERMPRGWRRPGAVSRLDQLLGYLRGRSTVEVLDLREPLIAAKARERVYSVTDTHWNGLGAHAAYAAILGRLARWYPTVAPRPRADFEARAVVTSGGDLAAGLGLGDRYPEVVLDLVPRFPLAAREVHRVDVPDGRAWAVRTVETPRRDQPRALFLHDSFGAVLTTLLSEHFSRTVLQWDTNLDLGLADRERPDVVVEERVERYLMLPPP